MIKPLAYIKQLLMLLSISMVACFISCSSANWKAEYYSTVLPTYDFDTNAPTMIVADPWDLSSKYYAGEALKALKKRGFNNIYLPGQIDNSFIRNVIYVKVTKERLDPASNYQYTFNAKGICNVINGVPSCSIDTRNSEATQRSEKRVVRDAYRVTFDWYDVYKKTRILYVAGSAAVDSGVYSDLQVLTTLLNDTITRMEFRRPVQYIYDGSLAQNNH